MSHDPDYPQQTPQSLGHAVRGGFYSGTQHGISRVVSATLVMLAVSAGAWWVADERAPRLPADGNRQVWRQEVSRAFQQVERGATYYTGYQLTDGTLQVFTDAAGVRKLVRHVVGGDSREFYFKDGALVFVYQHGPESASAANASPDVGHRYYFRRDEGLLGAGEPRMFEWRAPRRTAVDPNHPLFLARGDELLAEAEQLWKIATGT